MIDFEQLSLPVSALLFLCAALAVFYAGTRIAVLADRLADVTGLGEAVAGAVLLGATTSLSGIMTSVTAAADGHAELAVSNAVGGIAAQTFFIAVADCFYRRANLEHAAASVTNLINGAMLSVLLTLPLLAYLTPAMSVWSVHPCTPALIAAYLFGLHLASRTRDEPMWGPRRTAETRPDEPDEPPRDLRSIAPMLGKFALFAAIVAVAGYVIAKTGVVISSRTGVSEGLVGTLLTAVTTSLPELVTTLAAVRRGALTLAVGGILGGNTFDVLFIAFSDIAYRAGSIYHAMSGQQLYVIVLTMLMTSVLLLGLLRRERFGVANIGFESLTILVLYVGGMAVLTLVAR